MTFFETLKNSTIGAILFLGIALGTTIFLGFFQYIMFLIPPQLGGGEIPFQSLEDYTNIFGGIVIGMFVLPILEAFGILKVRFSDFRKSGGTQ